MMIHPRWRCVILLCALAACNGEDPAPDAAPAPAPPRAPPLLQRAEQLDSIQIEGTTEKIALRLVRPESSMPFLTYMPTDMIQETVSAGEGEGHYFYANFAGHRNDEAFVLVFILPRGATEADAVKLAKAFRDSRQRKGYIVKIDVRLHGDRYYYIGEQYPEAYADGFAPRSQRIQDEWQWLDAT